MCETLYQQIADLQQANLELTTTNNRLQKELLELHAVNTKLLDDSTALAKRRASTNKTSKEYYKKNRDERLAKQKDYNRKKKESTQNHVLTESVDTFREITVSTPLGTLGSLGVESHPSTLDLVSTATNAPVFVLVKRREK
jgi:hypothetical protein